MAGRENMVTEQLERVTYRNKEDLLRTNDCVSKKIGVPIDVTYHPHLDAINKIIRRNLKHLCTDQLVRSVFIPAPFISLRTPRNLRIHLVHFNELLVPISVILLVTKKVKMLKSAMSFRL